MSHCLRVNKGDYIKYKDGTIAEITDIGMFDFSVRIIESTHEDFKGLDWENSAFRMAMHGYVIMDKNKYLKSKKI